MNPESPQADRRRKTRFSKLYFVLSNSGSFLCLLSPTRLARKESLPSYTRSHWNHAANKVIRLWHRSIHHSYFKSAPCADISPFQIDQNSGGASVIKINILCVDLERLPPRHSQMTPLNLVRRRTSARSGLGKPRTNLHMLIQNSPE